MILNRFDEKISRRLPAEWERHGAILMAWPHCHTDWAYMLDEVRQCYRNIIAEIVKEEHVILLATNDTWTRDYGPLTAQTADGKPLILDFRFNGWGLKFAACHDNRATARLMEERIFSGDY